MIVVVAHRHDSAAMTLVQRWVGHGAKVLTCKDFTVPGWCVRSNAASTAVIDGTRVPVDDIKAVVTRLPQVLEEEVIEIAHQDRGYAAAEVNAFLLAWLSGLKCAVLNRPTPSCLMGPGWHREQWTQTAARLGIPVAISPRRHSPKTAIGPSAAVPELTTITVVGDRCLGARNSLLADYSRRLARAASVDLLQVHFEDKDGGSAFCNADLWPDIGKPEIQDAIFRMIEDRS
jgi:hypothetical protein